MLVNHPERSADRMDKGASQAVKVAEVDVAQKVVGVN